MAHRVAISGLPAVHFWDDERVNVVTEPGL